MEQNPFLDLIFLSSLTENSYSATFTYKLHEPTNLVTTGHGVQKLEEINNSQRNIINDCLYLSVTEVKTENNILRSTNG